VWRSQDNELWVINQDGSIASAMLDASNNQLYLAPADQGSGLIVSLTKYYWTIGWTIGANGSVGTIGAEDGTIATVDPSQLKYGSVTLTAPPQAGPRPASQVWWAAPCLQQVTPQLTAYRYVASTLTDQDNTTFVLNVSNPSVTSDDQPIVLSPLAANTSSQMWQITSDGRMLGGTDPALIVGLSPNSIAGGGWPLETQWAVNSVPEQTWSFDGTGLIANANGDYLTINGNPTSLSPSETRRR
jgi:hypothetical protein